MSAAMAARDEPPDAETNALQWTCDPAHRNKGDPKAGRVLTEAVGWAAAVVLLVTMIRQVWSQWVSGAVGGVSRWLFVGQVAASVGFTAYSLLLGNLVFAFTNGLLTINAVAGLCIDRRNRRLKAERDNKNSPSKNS